MATSRRVSLSPRFGYRREPAHRVTRRHGALLFEHESLVIAVTTDGPQLIPDVEVEWTLTPDSPVTFVLAAERAGPAIIVPPRVANVAVARDERGWAKWCDGLDAEVPFSELVIRSLLTLQLLTYSPSGAPVAAPTTSLPEEIGGSRNWDYRYAWPRDAAIGIGAFTAAGREREARAFLAWLLHATRLSVPSAPRAAHSRRTPARPRTGADRVARLPRVAPRTDRQRRVDPASARWLRLGRGRGVGDHRGRPCPGR